MDEAFGESLNRTCLCGDSREDHTDAAGQLVNCQYCACQEFEDAEDDDDVDSLDDP